MITSSVPPEAQLLGSANLNAQKAEASELVAASVDKVINSMSGNLEALQKGAQAAGKEIQDLTLAAESMLQDLGKDGTNTLVETQTDDKSAPPENDNEEVSKLKAAVDAGGFDLRGATGKKTPLCLFSC